MKNVDSQRRIVDSARLAGAIRHSSFIIFFCLIFSISAATSFAQSANRWLFVFNTSAAMRDRTNGMQAVTQDLLNTGMHGTIRPGDTIGIWTYSSQLHADEAPLQTWSPNAAPAISYNTSLFLGQHSYQHTAAFADVLANILRVIKISDVITVVLISDGSDSIKGTPFDDRIAAFYKTNYHSQRKARMPVVTVLRGDKGVITAHTLALAPVSVDIPAVPPPAPVKAIAKAAPVQPAAPRPVPSLVIIGTKAETTYNVPTDLPDHSGELAPQPPATPPQTESTPVVIKAEAPTVSTPEPAPAPKPEEKPKTVEAPVVAASAPPAVPAPTPAATVEQSKSTPSAEQVAAAPQSQESVAEKTTESPKVEATATAPQKELFSARNIAIVSVVFTLLVCTLLILSARNARRAVRASLITRSLDRER